MVVKLKTLQAFRDLNMAMWCLNPDLPVHQPCELEPTPPSLNTSSFVQPRWRWSEGVCWTQQSAFVWTESQMILGIASALQTGPDTTNPVRDYISIGGDFGRTQRVNQIRESKRNKDDISHYPNPGSLELIEVSPALNWIFNNQYFIGIKQWQQFCWRPWRLAVSTGITIIADLGEV